MICFIKKEYLLAPFRHNLLDINIIYQFTVFGHNLDIIWTLVFASRTPFSLLTKTLHKIIMSLYNSFEGIILRGVLTNR
jgi:hypothetical protein